MKYLPIVFLAVILAAPGVMGAQMMDHEKMMESQGMPGAGANECFKHSMEQAIQTHQMHMKDKSSDTRESNKEMMDQMEQARVCLSGSGTPGGGQAEQDKQTQCADEFLNRSMTLHQGHMDNPSTKTEASQKQLLRDMRKAYNCTGPARTITDGTGETER